jgi:hypothetical protein
VLFRAIVCALHTSQALLCRQYQASDEISDIYARIHEVRNALTLAEELETSAKHINGDSSIGIAPKLIDHGIEILIV